MRLTFWFATLVAMAADATVQPYTFVEVATRWDETGNAKEEYRFLKAINSAGASVTQDLSRAAGGLRQILHDGINTLIDPVKRSAVTGGYAQPRIAQASRCEERYRFHEEIRHTVRAEAERIAGVIVDRITLESPAGHREEWWVAPALDCAMLKSESFRNGRLIRRVQATEIRLGDPDPKLFEIPQDYTYTKVAREMK